MAKYRGVDKELYLIRSKKPMVSKRRRGKGAAIPGVRWIVDTFKPKKTRRRKRG